KRVFAPAGMETARVAERYEIVPGLAIGYTPGPGPSKIIKALAVPELLDLGASGIVASTRDLLKWHQALEKNLVLSAALKEKMQTSHGNAYGYGVSVHKLHGHRAISHDGRTDGYTTYYVRLPEENIVIAVFSNVATIARDYITSGVAAAVIGTDYEPPVPIETRESLNAAKAGIAGTYKFPPSWWYRIIVEDGHVYLSWMGREPTYLSPLPDGDFFMRIRYERLSFPLNESGVCEEALYYWGENPVKCPRIKQ
ncbi:MAG: beta-lactamase family protein, partial [Holophagales bacterium]|nr:beta-lactamase family protein [Holophagales bacterium]